MQQKTAVINTPDSLSPAETAYEIWSWVVTGDTSVTPGVNGCTSRLSTGDLITQNETLMPGVKGAKEKETDKDKRRDSQSKKRTETGTSAPTANEKHMSDK